MNPTDTARRKMYEALADAIDLELGDKSNVAKNLRRQCTGSALTGFLERVFALDELATSVERAHEEELDGLCEVFFEEYGRSF